MSRSILQGPAESLNACSYILVYSHLHFDHLRLQGDTKEEHSKVPSPSVSFASENLHINGKGAARASSSLHRILQLLLLPDINLQSPVTKLDPAIELAAGSGGWGHRLLACWGPGPLLLREAEQWTEDLHDQTQNAGMVSLEL